VLTGGSPATWPAVSGGTPCARSPARSVCGSDPARPEIISEKHTPMDSAVPEFWKVERMPEATPRCSGATLPMIADVFGAENMPWPMPLSSSSPANSG